MMKLHPVHPSRCLTLRSPRFLEGLLPAWLPLCLALYSFPVAPIHAAPAANAINAVPSEKPEEFLRRSLDYLLHLAATHPTDDPRALGKTVRPALEKIFNFESLTKKSLGIAWRELSAEQQKQAVALFSELIIRSYTTRFDPHSKLEIDFSRASQLGDGKMEVPATAKHQGNSVRVAYRVDSSPRGWVVYDVIIEGVSLTQNYRAQFDEIRQRNSSTHILRSMEQKLK
jgi:phospholipid transport system substrate-binding protein